jgi:hypothetical protein
LFDRRQDSQEMQNRAQDPAYRKTMETLHQKLHEWMDQTQDPILQTTDEEAFKAVLKKRFR